MDLRTLISSVKHSKGRPTVQYDALLELLRSKHNEGLKDDELISILKMLTSPELNKCSGILFKSLFYLCVPEGTVNNDIIDIVLLWVLSSYHSVLALKINVAIDWITILVDLSIADGKHVDSYYNLFYGLLNFPNLQKVTCRLLYQLTKPKDVFRGRVERVYREHLKNGQKKYTSSLLGLFKVYKPELVPENVQMFSADVAFGRQNEQFMIACQETGKRIEAQPSQNRHTYPLKLQWIGVSSNKKNFIIPSASNKHVGSVLYRENKLSVTEFSDKESLALSSDNLQLPSCILSLLLNEGGIHLLATLNSEVAARFSVALFSTLNSVFFSNSKLYSDKDRDQLLQKIIILEEYMQQGIPVVSRFLALYIASWNGLDHREYIYKLLEYLTFSSFEEFNSCILGHLQTLFLSANIPVKCTVINTLKKLICNLIISRDCFYSQETPKAHKFLRNEQHWNTDFGIAIPMLIKVVSDLCNQGLLLTSNNSVILHTVLCFYEDLLNIYEVSGKDISVISPFSFYRAMFSLHFSAFSRVCNLLCRYKDLEDQLKETHIEPHYANWLNDYSYDIWNCLLNEKAFTKGKEGYIFQSDSEKFKELPLRDSAFCLKNNMISFCLEAHWKRTSESENSSEPLSQALKLEILREIFPDVARCSGVITEKYTDYHK